MTEMQSFLVTFFGVLSTTHARPNAGMEFHNLFDSIQKSDLNRTRTYRIFLEQEAAREQQAFDAMKYELRLKRHRNVHEQKNIDGKSGKRVAAFKREASTASAIPNITDVHKQNVYARRHRQETSTILPLSRRCILERCSELKDVHELNSLDLALVVQNMDEKYRQLESLAARSGVVAYECWKFTRYETLWHADGPPGADFVPEYIPENLPKFSAEDYRHYHEIWKTILDSSEHQGVERFRRYLTHIFGIMKNGKVELDTEQISRKIAFARVILQNSKDVMAKEASRDLFPSAREVRSALAELSYIEDPDTLDVVEMFEEITKGQEPKNL